MSSSGGDDDDEKIMRKKLVVIGDGYCGKTSMLLSFSHNRFPENYIPTVCEATTKDIEIDGVHRSLVLWDTAGQEDYDRLRAICYSRTDVVIICYAVDDRVSFENVRLKWLPEVRHFCPRAPILLVGNKIDLRRSANGASAFGSRRGQGDGSSPDTDEVSTGDAAALARALDANLFLECSAKTREGIELVFEAAARLAYRSEGFGQPHSAQKKQRFCALV